MKIVYIAHPIGGYVDGNLEDLRRIIKHINLTMPDIVPYCPYYADVVSLCDNTPAERKRGMDNGIMTLGLAHEVWLCGDRISEGMRTEIDHAETLGIPLINKIGKI